MDKDVFLAHPQKPAIYFNVRIQSMIEKYVSAHQRNLSCTLLIFAKRLFSSHFCKIIVLLWLNLEHLIHENSK